MKTEKADKNQTDWFNAYQDVDMFLFRECCEAGLDFPIKGDNPAENTIEAIKLLINKEKQDDKN